MKHFFAGILVLSATCVYAQNSATVANDKEYYEFFNSVVQPYSEIHFVLQSEAETFDFVYKSGGDDKRILDTIFAKSDSATLYEQATKARYFAWGPGMINGAKVANQSDITNIVSRSWAQFDETFGCREYWVYSVPLFSADKKTCVVKYVCYNDSGIGSGIVYYYVKNNDKWVAVYHYRTMVGEKSGWTDHN